MSVSFQVEERLPYPLDVCLFFLGDYWAALGVGSRLVAGRGRTSFRVVTDRYALFPVTGDVKLRAAGRSATAIGCRGVVDIHNFPFASTIATEIVKRGIRNAAAYIGERVNEVA